MEGVWRCVGNAGVWAFNWMKCFIEKNELALVIAGEESLFF